MRKWSCSLLLSMQFASAFSSLDYNEQEMFDAKIFYDAGEYVKARGEYKKLLLQLQEDWKKSIILYNIATTYLSEGDYIQAIRELEAIPVGKNPYPLLKRYIQSNIAVARWREAKRVIDKLTQDQKYHREEYLHSFFMLNQALANVDAASSAHCEVEELEGSNLCVPAYDLNKLRNAIQQQMAQLYLQFQSIRTEALTPTESISALLAGMHSLSSAIVDLLVIKIDSINKNQHIERILLQARTWTVLWNEMIKKQASNKLLKEAAKDYEIFLQSLKENKLKYAQKKLGAIEDSINIIFLQLLDNDPITQLLQKLIASYQRSIISIPIQQMEITSLIDQQALILQIFEKKNITHILLDEAQEILKISAKFSHTGKSEYAKIYLLGAYQNIQKLSWIHQPENESNVENFLEHVIGQQTAAVMVGHLINKIGEDSEGLAIKSQKKASNFAKGFWSLVMEEQKSNYRLSSVDSDGNKMHPCQFQPWNEVVPLFDSGYNETLIAEKILQNSSSELIVLQHQDQSLSLWQKALDVLRAPPSSQNRCNAPPTSPEGANDESQDQQQQPQGQKTLDKWDTSIDEVLRLLQMMEQEDRQKKAPVESGSQSQEKPW